MGLYVTTTGTSVPIPELGIVLRDPTSDFDVKAQFSEGDIKHADSLTAAIQSGLLLWRDHTGISTYRAPGDYDPDLSEVQDLNTGTGDHPEQIPTFGDLLEDKSGEVLHPAFSGDPQKADVTFDEPFPDNNYTPIISSGSDGRTWLAENRTAGGFTVNSQARTLLTGPVSWVATYNGESK